jgi:hypothetical protein
MFGMHCNVILYQLIIFLQSIANILKIHILIPSNISSSLVSVFNISFYIAYTSKTTFSLSSSTFCQHNSFVAIIDFIWTIYKDSFSIMVFLVSYSYS